MLAAWHATLEVGTPVASAEFLVGAFEALGRAQARRAQAGGSLPRRRGLPRRRRRGGGARHRPAVAVRAAARAARADGARDLRRATASAARTRGCEARAPSGSARGSRRAGADLGDRLLVGAEVDRVHAELPGGLDVQLVVVDEQELLAARGRPGARSSAGRSRGRACACRPRRSRRPARRSRPRAASTARAPPTRARCW